MRPAHTAPLHVSLSVLIAIPAIVGSLACDESSPGGGSGDVVTGTDTSDLSDMVRDFPASPDDAGEGSETGDAGQSDPPADTPGDSLEAGSLLDEIDTDPLALSDLAWDGALIWATVLGGELVSVDPETGHVEEECELLGAENPRGLTFDGSLLWYTDGSTAAIYWIDPADCTTEFACEDPPDDPPGQNTAPVSLAWSDGHLFLSETDTNTIFEIDPDDCTAVNSFAPPGEVATGITFYDGVLYAGDAELKVIYALDPEDGSVLDSFEARVVGGMTFDGADFLLTDSVRFLIRRVHPPD